MPKSDPSDKSADLKDTSLGRDFKLERYKYILQEIHFLNENIRHYLTLFQTLATATISGGIAVFVSWQNLNITALVAKAGIQGLVGLLVILALFVLISILAGIFSWFDYRKEEVNLLNEVIGLGFRDLARKRNFWRWYETYILVFIILVVIAIVLYTEFQIIPLIK